MELIISHDHIYTCDSDSCSKYYTPMASPTNLTERISQLRQRKGGFLPDQQPQPPLSSPKSPQAPVKARKFATDTFMLLAYGLFAAALAAQLFLIAWLDLP